MAWNGAEKENTRSTALMSWAQYPEIAGTREAVTKVLGLFEGASAPQRLRASAYATLFVVAGVPQSERPKGVPLSATVPFEELVDWNPQSLSRNSKSAMTRVYTPCGISWS